MRKFCMFRYNNPVTFSRRIITLVIDFLILLILTLLCYLSYEQISAKMTNAKTSVITEEARELQGDISSLLEEAHLGYMVNGNICDTGEMAENYVTTLYKYSLDELHEEYTDPLYLYYGEYKQMHANEFVSNVGNIGNQYVNNRMMQQVENDSKQYYEWIDSWSYPMLRSEVATALKAWMEEQKETITIREKEYNGAKIAEDIVSVYKLLMEEARNEFASNYSGYAEQYERLSELRSELVGCKIKALLSIYLMITIVWYLIFPMLLKNGASVSNKIFKMGACTKRGDEIPLWSIVLKWLMKILKYFYVIYFVLILLYSINSKTFMDYRIFGNLKLSILYFVSTGVMIISIVCCAMDKKKYRTLSDLVSMQEMKDIRE